MQVVAQARRSGRTTAGGCCGTAPVAGRQASRGLRARGSSSSRPSTSPTTRRALASAAVSRSPVSRKYRPRFGPSSRARSPACCRPAPARSGSGPGRRSTHRPCTRYDGSQSTALLGGGPRPDRLPAAIIAHLDVERRLVDHDGSSLRSIGASVRSRPGTDQLAVAWSPLITARQGNSSAYGRATTPPASARRAPPRRRRRGRRAPGARRWRSPTGRRAGPARAPVAPQVECDDAMVGGQVADQRPPRLRRP